MLLLPFPSGLLQGRQRRLFSPLPLGASVLLFQHLPLLHLVLFLGDGLNVYHLIVLICSCNGDPSPELDAHRSGICCF